MGLEWKMNPGDPQLKAMIEADLKRRIAESKKDVERAVQQEVCATHGKRATVQVKQSGTRATFDISACCDELAERALAAADRAVKS